MSPAALACGSFGPVLAVVHVDGYETAAHLINEQEIGNGAAISRTVIRPREFSHQIQVGIVGVNKPIPVPMSFHSFGGWKASLLGDHHLHGPKGGRFHTRLKTITSRWPTNTWARR